jgi:hypothetical protein
MKSQVWAEGTLSNEGMSLCHVSTVFSQISISRYFSKPIKCQISPAITI